MYPFDSCAMSPEEATDGGAAACIPDAFAALEEAVVEGAVPGLELVEGAAFAPLVVAVSPRIKYL